MSNHIFVAREKEINQILDYIARLEFPSKAVYIRGESGIGKSELLSKVIEKAINKGVNSSGIIDLQGSSVQHPVAVIQRILQRLSSNSFLGTTSEIEVFIDANDEQKLYLKQNVIETFLKEYRDFANDRVILIVFDTFESLTNKALLSFFFDTLLPALLSCSHVIIAGQSIIKNELMMEIELVPFGIDELRKLSDAIFFEKGIVDPINNSNLVEIQKVSKGSPLLAAIMLLWIRDVGENLHSTNSDLLPSDFVFKNPELTANHLAIIRLMTALHKRFNSTLVGLLTTIEDPDAILLDLRRFPFVKYHSISNTYSLHEKFSNSLGNVYALSSTRIGEIRMNAIEKYYDVELEKNIDELSRQSLSLEKLEYLLNSTPQIGVELFKSEFEKGLDSYEFDYCFSLFGVIERSEISPRDKLLISLLRGELLKKKFDPSHAAKEFETVCRGAKLIDDASLLARALNGLGGCMLQGYIVGEQGIRDAIDRLQEALSLSDRTITAKQLARIKYSLGYAYELLGNHSEAEDYYEQAFKESNECNDLLTVAQSTDRLSEISRRSGHLDEGMEYAIQGLKAREKLNIPKELANSYKALAQAHRDQENLDEADRLYQKAISIYNEIGDEFNLSDLLGSIAYTALRKGDLDKAKEFVGRALEIENRIHYFSELSWEYHTLLEIRIKENADLPELYVLCDKALALARDYNVVFMILDLLSHRAEFDLIAGDYSKLDDYLTEVDGFLERGCKYTFFKARILKALGDSWSNRDNNDKAFLYYADAYHIYAIAQSFAFKDKYEELLKTHLKVKLDALESKDARRYAGILTSYWIKEGLDERYSALIDLCETYIDTDKT